VGDERSNFANAVLRGLMKESGRQHRLHQSFSENGVVVIGVDLKKDRAVPERAYNDTRGGNGENWEAAGGKQLAGPRFPGSVRRVFPRWALRGDDVLG
jgi:hypothetical protein